MESVETCTQTAAHWDSFGRGLHAEIQISKPIIRGQMYSIIVSEKILGGSKDKK